MTRQRARSTGWAARAVKAGVRMDLLDVETDDYAFAVFGLTIVRTVTEASLSDDDVYPLLVRYWNGDWPLVDWPPDAPGGRAAVRHGAREPLSVRT